MSETIFISRDIASNSDISQIAQKWNLEVIAHSLLHHNLIPFKEPEKGILFFYSKTAVQLFFQHLTKVARTDTDSFFKKYKAICFGPKTAAFCSSYCEVLHQGDSDAKDLTDYVNQLLEEQSITFVCGQSSLKSVHGALSHEHVKELIIYKTEQKTDSKLGAYKVALLTSPLNVAQFVASGGIAAHYIAIGQTTLSALKDRDIEGQCPAETTEEAMAELLEDILKASS